jgi:hypothetical protein
MTPCPAKSKEWSRKYKDVQEKENKSNLMLAKDKGIDTILEIGTAINWIKQLVLRWGKKYYLFKNSFSNSYKWR